MWQDFKEWLPDAWRAYRKPIIVLLFNGAVYDVFGVPIECSRCPVPPMQGFEKFLFVMGYLVCFICTAWICWIYAVRKAERDRF